MSPDSVDHVTLTDMDGTNPREVLSDDRKDGLRIIAWPRWAGEDHMYFGAMDESGRSFTQLYRGDLTTGEFTPILESLGDHVRLRNYAPSYDGKYIVVSSQPKNMDEGIGIFMTNVMATDK